MGTFLQNWMMLRAQSAPRGGEIPDPLVDDYVQNGLIIHLDGKMKGGDSTKWIDRKGLVSFNYGSAITPAADGVITTEGGAVASNEVFADHYIDTTSYSFEMVWELTSSPGTYMIFATPRSGGVGPYIGVTASYAIFGDRSIYRTASQPSNYSTLQISSGVSSSTVLMDGVSQSTSGSDYFGGDDLHFWLGSVVRKLPNAKLKCIRLYNRPLTTAEMLHNLAVDNERFNLGLRIYIPFADPAVEAICVANWSSDGVGLTLQDAARVTSFSGKFRDNTSIEYFNELQYFTGVSTIGLYEFRNCTNLKEISIVQNLGDSCFKGCSGLTKISFLREVTMLGGGSNSFSNVGQNVTRIDIPNISWWMNRRSGPALEVGCNLYINDVKVTEVTIPASVTNCGIGFNYIRDIMRYDVSEGVLSCGTYCFAHGTEDSVYDLPSTFTSIGDEAFGGTSGILICRATTPPTVVGNLGAIKRIYVPYGYGDIYKATNKWSSKSSVIFELNPDGTIPS